MVSTETKHRDTVQKSVVCCDVEAWRRGGVDGGVEVDQISFSRNEINMTMIISLYCEGRERGGEHTICTARNVQKQTSARPWSVPVYCLHPRHNESVVTTNNPE